MSIKTKTPGGNPAASRACHSRSARQVHYPTKTAVNQPVPMPGTALSAYLKKYRDELNPYRKQEHGQRLLTAILVLLNEADR